VYIVWVHREYRYPSPRLGIRIRVPYPRIIILITFNGCVLFEKSAGIHYRENTEDDSWDGVTPAVVLHSPIMGSFRNICIYMASLVVI